MKEQFCSYVISLKLKELGFDEDCMAYYKSECTGENTLLSKFTLDHSKTVFYTQTNNNREISAPLWQQVIDWLNSKNLYIFFYRGENSRYRNVFTFCILNTHYTLVDFDFENGNSDFYIIREQAILKAIELITK